MVSIIIPYFNEEKYIINCLISLSIQNYKDFEVIIIDDGSKISLLSTLDKVSKQSTNIVSIFKKRKTKISFYRQKHLGPAIARNYGVLHAKGDILVFVDCDMEFDTNFVSDLVYPIENKETIGTFSKEEYLKNNHNVWSLCWNINRYLINGWKLNREVYERILPKNYPCSQMVFRAILRKEFDKVKGFDSNGYTDDWTLSRKLKKEAIAVEGAKCFHYNPETVDEIFQQASWIGKNEFINRNKYRQVYNLLRYSFFASLLLGFYETLRYRFMHFIIFKVIYDFAVSLSIARCLFSKERLYK